MAEKKKREIWINLADVDAIPLVVNPEDEKSYKDAEKYVNTLWDKYTHLFGENATSHEVLARVAFRFAKLYLDEFGQNKEVNAYLADFEKELDK
ncbi:MAG: cell division protein ZapA, partial [Bacteroidales bacterium]|nr:cell division protein ZapA [Candidatus Sodaliphilus aphodohippi]